MKYKFPKKMAVPKKRKRGPLRLERLIRKYQKPKGDNFGNLNLFSKKTYLIRIGTVRPFRLICHFVEFGIRHEMATSTRFKQDGNV